MRNAVGLIVLVSIMLSGMICVPAGAQNRIVFGGFACGVHIGGNWGLNAEWIKLLPDSWFDYLRSLNADWVGISISMTLDGSMDRTIETCGPDNSFQTFDEDELRNLIRALKANGFHVYLTLAFVDVGGDDEPEGQQVQRWQLGDPYIYNEEPRVWKEYWPWDPDHPDHESFVRDFFASYTAFAVRYARLCEQEGVELFSLGTETDRLFRTRTQGSRWPTEYKDELSEMVREVHEVYDGAVTYDMLSFSFTDPFPAGLHSLWDDVGMDAIGISAYFDVLSSLRTAASLPPSDTALDAAWEGIFRDYLIPLAADHLDLPIYFLEFGYVDYPGCASNPGRGEFTARTLIDRNEDGLDDGEEEQAATFAAFFRAVGKNPGILAGVFLWGEMIAPDGIWTTSFGCLRGFSVRQKLAEDVVRQAYTSLGDAAQAYETASDASSLSDVDWSPIPDSIQFRRSPDVPTDALYWEGPGRDVHALTVVLEEDDVLIRLELNREDEFGDFRYSVGIRHPNNRDYLSFTLFPNEDYASVSAQWHGDWLDLGYVCNEAVDSDGRTCLARIPCDLFASTVDPGLLDSWYVTLILSRGVPCGHDELYFFPDTGAPYSLLEGV